MKRFGIVSYNIYCNFTNYGSALQSYALSQAINKTGVGKWESVLVDYCPDILKDKDALNILNRRIKDLKQYNFQEVANGLMRDVYETYIENSSNSYKYLIILLYFIIIGIIIVIFIYCINKSSPQEDKVKTFLDK